MKAVCAVFPALGLIACSAIGIWLAIATLPGIVAPPPEIWENGPSSTWVGQGAGGAYGLGFLLLILIYVAKWWILRFASRTLAAFIWYGLAVACSLPYIWFLVVVDWQNPFVYRISCWVYDPIGIWAVPTASFAWDVARRTPWPSDLYFLRSFAEIVFIVPIWLLIWAYFSFFFLGGGWI